jgi:hypothetical protein
MLPCPAPPTARSISGGQVGWYRYLVMSKSVLGRVAGRGARINAAHAKHAQGLIAQGLTIAQVVALFQQNIWQLETVFLCHFRLDGSDDG